MIIIGVERASGVRAAIRKSGLSPATVYAIFEGKPVHRYILETFRRRVFAKSDYKRQETLATLKRAIER